MSWYAVQPWRTDIVARCSRVVQTPANIAKPPALQALKFRNVYRTTHHRCKLYSQKRMMTGTDTPVAAPVSPSQTEVGVDPPSDQQDTIFGKIARGEIPAKFVYQDEHCVVIDDISPQAPVHFLVLPRKPIQRLAHCQVSDIPLLGHLLYIAKQVAETRHLDSGYRVVINDGKDGCQSVYHLHIHVLGQRTLGWPPG
uniref:Histidine triad nucleotide-binding protein 2, mitochondrial n=2 Tax=Lygus hesperus TaxID=30085 RepID=A0A146LTQ3_LYGHE